VDKINTERQIIGFCSECQNPIIQKDLLTGKVVSDGKGGMVHVYCIRKRKNYANFRNMGK
jgi:ribosomal protein L21